MGGLIVRATSSSACSRFPALPIATTSNSASMAATGPMSGNIRRSDLLQVERGGAAQRAASDRQADGADRRRASRLLEPRRHRARPVPRQRIDLDGGGAHRPCLPRHRDRSPLCRRCDPSLAAHDRRACGPCRDRRRLCALGDRGLEAPHVDDDQARTTSVRRARGNSSRDSPAIHTGGPRARRTFEPTCNEASPRNDPVIENGKTRKIPGPKRSRFNSSTWPRRAIPKAWRPS